MQPTPPISIMFRHILFLQLCFSLVSSVHDDCLADQERYGASFDTLFPKCTTHGCMEKKKIYDANFEELFPWCKKLKESERKTQTVNLGVISSPGEIVQKR